MDSSHADSGPNWGTVLAKKIILECVEKKRGQIEGGGGGSNDVSLVEIYAEGAGKLGVGIRELARHVVRSSLNTLLQTASAIATPSSSGSGEALPAGGAEGDVKSNVDKLVHENATIITTMRSNIIKAELKPNYALMGNFVKNCRDILGKLEGLPPVPNFNLVVDMVG
ncbi:hypothetical protein TrRE_jg2150, partial [Triparma retinervis]